jgi:hypothetical protein
LGCPTDHAELGRVADLARTARIASAKLKQDI